MLTLTVGIGATQMNFAQTEGLGFLMAQAVFAGVTTCWCIWSSRSTSCARLPERQANEATLALLPACSAGGMRAARHAYRAVIHGSSARVRRISARHGSGKAQGECGIITAMINQFEAANPDIKVVRTRCSGPDTTSSPPSSRRTVPPDLVTMHSSAIPDYDARNLLDPLDDDLRAVGLSPGQFTSAARAGVTVDGKTMGLPIDVWAPLWHVNMNLFREAGLVANGMPVLPTSTGEFHAHAEQFRQRTGKPYLIQVTNKDFAGPMRIFYAWMLQQGAPLFLDARHSNFDSIEGRRALDFMKALYERGDSARNLDYAGAVSGFLKGEGGVLVDGTWMSAFDAAPRQCQPADRGYAVRPFPFVSGNALRLWMAQLGDATQRNALRPTRSGATFSEVFCCQRLQGHAPATSRLTAVIEERECSSSRIVATSPDHADGEPLPSTCAVKSPSNHREKKPPRLPGAKPVRRLKTCSAVPTRFSSFYRGIVQQPASLPIRDFIIERSTGGLRRLRRTPGRCITAAFTNPDTRPPMRRLSWRRARADAGAGRDRHALAGGNFVSGYNWRDAWDPSSCVLPARSRLFSTETNQFGTNEFITWCRKAGIEPMMAVNLGRPGP